MQKPNTANHHNILKWGLWVLLLQLVLVNICASIYAYKFTHYYAGPVPPYKQKNILVKTWKIFIGPDLYKDTLEPAPPFPYRTVSLLTSDHHSIDAWYSEVDSPRGCVIFFHGLSVNKSYLISEASEFRKWGYNILMVDFRGHGRSEGNYTSFGVRETGEVEKAFEFARAKGNRQIILYGSSLGAAVCIKAVSERKVQPNGIIADMPFGSLKQHLQSRAEAVGFSAEPFATLVTFWIGVERGYNGFGHKVTSYARQLSCPVLVEWGERDKYVKPGEIKGIIQGISSDKKLQVYPGAGHQDFLQYDQEVWTSQVRSFADSLCR